MLSSRLSGSAVRAITAKDFMRYIIVVFTLAFLTCAQTEAGEQNEMTRQSCRASKETDVIANCIEAGIYDPCDDAGGKWGQSQCAWAHSLVAQRRIEKSLEALEDRSIKAGIFDQYQNLQWSQKNFELYRDQYCRFKGAASEKSADVTGETLGYCIRRLNEERASDLESILKVAPREN